MNTSFTKLILISLTLAGCTSERADNPLGTVRREDLVQRVTLSGTIEPARKTAIQVSYEGFVKELLVHVGDRVKKNDPLASVTSSLVSREQVFPLRAPYAGTVVQIYKKEGEYLSPNSTGTDPANRILQLDDLSRLFVDAAAPEVDVQKIKIGLGASIKASAVLNKNYTGVIRELSLAAREQDRWSRGQVEFPCRIEITDADGQLKPGMSVIADLIVGQYPKVLTLGHEFVQKDGEKYFVTLKDGKRRDVTVGVQNEEVFEIRTGLKEGDEVRQVDFLELIKKGGA